MKAAGANTAEQADTVNAAPAEQTDVVGTYYPPGTQSPALGTQSPASGTQSPASGTQSPVTGGYYQPEAPAAQGTPYSQPGVQGTQGSAYNQPGAQGPAYYQPGAQGTQSGPYYQSGAQGAQGGPFYQPGTQGARNAAFYQNNPYSGSPGYPAGGPPKNNKNLVIIVSIIIGLLLIGGGILAYILLSGNGNSDDPPVSVSDVSEAPSEEPSEEPSEAPSEAPSEEPSAEPSEEPSAESAQFDSVTQENIDAACLDTGMDLSLIEDMRYYGTWYEGDVYTFMYDGSVVDLLLYEDGTVYSLETGGAQIYLISYDSYYIQDYLGYMTHFDESYPDNSYVFYMDREYVDAAASIITIDTSDDLDYVVELIDAATGNLVIAFYCQYDSNVPMPVPAGDYIIQYAAGPYWIDIPNLFGEDTVFFRSVDTFYVNDENEAYAMLDVYGGTGIPSTEITIDEF
jgi:hypothetical protein